MDKHWIFWLTFGSLITLIELFLFIIIFGCICIDTTFVFHKEYCLILLPNLIYFMFQFVINYAIITEKLNNKKL